MFFCWSRVCWFTYRHCQHFTYRRSSLLFEPHPTPLCIHRSNNTRDLCSVATYNVRSTRNVTMPPPPHPTPPHHDLRTHANKNVRFTSTVFGLLANTCIHAYIHACTQTYIQTYIHTDRHTDIQTDRHTDIQNTYIQTYIHTHTHIHTHIHTYTDTHTHRHTERQRHRYTDKQMDGWMDGYRHYVTWHDITSHHITLHYIALHTDIQRYRYTIIYRRFMSRCLFAARNAGNDRWFAAHSAANCHH